MYTEATYALLSDALVRPFISLSFFLSFWRGVCGGVVVEKTLVADLLGIAFRRPPSDMRPVTPASPRPAGL